MQDENNFAFFPRVGVVDNSQRKATMCSEFYWRGSGFSKAGFNILRV